MNNTQTTDSVEMVNLTIDGNAVCVPKGTNLIEAAKLIKKEIPHYCYHPDLSVPGNCRMCQVEVEGAPKLLVGCATNASEGMVVRTQATSEKVKNAQESTLEFILINHPLDCTVCDQAGHCKLQDYHYEYNAKPSRFLKEDKEHKVKAEVLGPNVILDGERCIMCTRCIRFCDEITETSELGMLNRGDKSVIAVNPGKELNNDLSGTVVDLCPVGALTHRKWRFNTRIWYTKQTDSICTGCSTGCNVKVAVRDDKIVQVKARYNEKVNKEWMCDEGRYGFDRFLPKSRLQSPVISEEGNQIDDFSKAAKTLKAMKEEKITVFVAPDLMLEEYYVAKLFVEATFKNARVVISYKKRPLNEVQKKLVSPDYAANYKGAIYSGLVGENVESDYDNAIMDIYNGNTDSIMCIGERAIDFGHHVPDLYSKISELKNSIGILSDSESGLVSSLKVVFAGRSVLEKSGLLVNKDLLLQYSERVIDFPNNTDPEWRILNKLSKELGKEIVKATSDRELTLAYLAANSDLSEQTIKSIKREGVSL